MLLKISPNALRTAVDAFTATARSFSAIVKSRSTGVRACCSTVNACSDVEERRFSAASIVAQDAGFSPSGRYFYPRARTAIILLALAAASPFSARAQKSAGASVTADLPPGEMRAKAITACTECHEARVILQQRLSKAAWGKEVDKMTKWGAVVDAADRDALVDYLSTNFNPEKPAYEPQRTVGSKSAKRTSK